jgi:GTP-binding protein
VCGLFHDYAKIFLKSGDGGAGIVGFRREKYVPRGGPDGGDGGRGGHIIFQVRDELTTLSDFRYKRHFKAEPGCQGDGGNRTGKDGSDLFVPVPAGTIIRNVETGQILGDLTEPGSEHVILRGGRGGRGNARFATATRQAPQISEKGEPGTEMWVELELKLLADVGLIGFPNVGKSTLISKISAARPKIADYPFTTLTPNLGVVDHKGRSFVAVDIPGLIEGAHQGIGLGLQFLRHVERTRILLHLVDVSGFSGREPYQDYLTINSELNAYSQVLAAKKQIVILNKIDSPQSAETVEELTRKFNGTAVFPISAATGAGVSSLLDEVIKVLDATPVEIQPLAVRELPVAEDSIITEVVRDGAVYVLKNSALERRILRFNLDNDDAVRSFQRLLKRWKVEDALKEAGVREGDTVRIADFEFTYLPED